MMGGRTLLAYLFVPPSSPHFASPPSRLSLLPPSLLPPSRPSFCATRALPLSIAPRRISRCGRIPLSISRCGRRIETSRNPPGQLRSRPALMAVPPTPARESHLQQRCSVADPVQLLFPFFFLHFARVAVLYARAAQAECAKASCLGRAAPAPRRNRPYRRPHGRTHDWRAPLAARDPPPPPFRAHPPPSPPCPCPDPAAAAALPPRCRRVAAAQPPPSLRTLTHA